MSNDVKLERRFRHKKRGTEYTLIGVGRAQGTLHDEDPVVLYRGDDGGLWVRHQVEFCDGRFEEIEPRHQPQREAVLEAVRKVRDGYASQAKFADHEPASYFREFVQRLDAALTTPAPTVSRDDQALFNDICDKMAEVVAALPGIPDAPGQHAGTRATEPGDGDEA